MFSKKLRKFQKDILYKAPKRYNKLDELYNGLWY